jgi:GDP-mannose 6-dehydrogenase
MKIAIFGMGYVGIVSAACFARDGHEVIGVDVNPAKVASLQAGKPPIIEPGLEELLARSVSEGRLQATQVPSEALSTADLAMVCVGTPSNENGSLNLDYVKRVCAEIGEELRSLNNWLDIVIRSTMLPGSSDQLIEILEASSGKEAGEDFGFVVNPEFLREGCAIADFDDPPYTVIGEFDARSGDQLEVLYDCLTAPIYRVPLGVAEMVKYASNAFHALKVVFANELGNICQAYGVDSHEVMDIFVRDEKLNISPSYLKPGFSFGGSCLGKDLRALLYSAKKVDLSAPVLQAILPSNQYQIQKGIDVVLRNPGRRVAVVGLSFKPNTDDLRESPAVEMVERLIGKGLEVRIYDREVALSQLHGSNRDFIEKTLPHIGELISDSLGAVITAADTVVITKSLPDTENEAIVRHLRPGQLVLDLVRLPDSIVEMIPGDYLGIAW